MNFLDADCKVEGDKVVLDVQGTKMILDGEKAAKMIENGCDGKTVVVGIRPEDVHNEAAMIEKNADTSIEATVQAYEMLGAEGLLYVDYQGTQMIAKVDPRTKAVDGEVVKLAFEKERIHVFDKETEMVITH